MNSGGVQYQYYRGFIYIVFLIGLFGCFHNEVPISDAGDSQNVLVADKVLLDGSRSYDIDGAIVEFKWSLIQSPQGSNAFLNESDIVDPTFIADVAGAYVVGLVVFDGELYSDKDIVVITATEDEGVSIKPPIQSNGLFRQYVTLVDNSIIIQSVFSSELLNQNNSIESLNANESSQSMSDQISSGQLLNKWVLVKKPADSNPVLTLNDNNEMEFITDMVGDYSLLLTHNLDEPFIGIAKAFVRVQETKVSAGEDRKVVIGNPAVLKASIIDDIDQSGIKVSWELIQQPNESNVQVETIGQYTLFMPDVAGLYQLILSVSSGSDTYTDSVSIEAVSDDAVFDHTATTSPCDQCHIKPIDPIEPKPEPIPTPTFPLGLELTISGIDMTYQLGDIIKLSATLTNTSDVDVEYYKMTSSSVGVTVEIQTASGSRFRLRHPADPDFDLQVVTKAILMPGDSITRMVEWDQSIPGEKMAVPGSYQVNAYAFVTQLNGETSGDFSSTGSITIESTADIITEVNAILSGLKDARVNQWYVKSKKSILCSTESEGLVLINDYVATPIQTLVAVPDSEINCTAKLFVAVNQWRIKYRSTTPSENDRFEIAVDATTGAIIPKFDLIEMK